MALITAPQIDMPSNEYELHTVIIDTIDHTNKTDFTSFLPTPLENVVQAQLMAATITSTGTAQSAFHIGIEELRSYFSQRGKEDLGDSTDNHLNGIFGTIVGSHTLLAGSGTGAKVVLFKNDYPIIQSYHNPIRKLDRLNFNIDRQDGQTASMSAGMFIFRFTCKKRNLA
tara:strand:- start:6826 stop:7335 length:510 start_codon:yes stop_codon:yes gene_type:complete